MRKAGMGGSKAGFLPDLPVAEGNPNAGGTSPVVVRRFLEFAYGQGGKDPRAQPTDTAETIAALRTRC